MTPAMTTPTTDHQALDEALTRDEHLLAAYRSHGDRESLAQLVERLSDPAHRLAVRLAGNQADADDVLQEAVLALMSSAHQYRRTATGSVRSWFLGIVANAYRRRARAEHRRCRREHDAMVPGPVGNDPAQGQWDEEVRRALGELPEHERMPILLRHADELAIIDIAAALGRKEKTVRSQIDRGLERLRAMLSVRCGLRPQASIISALAVAYPSAQPVEPRLRAALQDRIRQATPVVAAAGPGVVLALLLGVAGLAVLAAGVALFWHGSQVPEMPAGTRGSLAGLPDAIAAAGAVASAAVAVVDGVPAGDAIIGRVFDAEGRPLDGAAVAPGLMHERVAVHPALAPQHQHDQWLRSGIKAVDLLGPMVEGGIVELYAPNGTGRWVLIDELARRWRDRENGTTLIVSWDMASGNLAGLRQDLIAVGNPPAITIVWGDETRPQQDERLATTAATMATVARDQGHRVLLVVTDTPRHQRLIEVLRAHAGFENGGSITLLLNKPAEAVVPATPLDAGTDVRLVLAKGPEFNGTYPLIDAELTHSRYLDDHASPRHVAAAQDLVAAIELLRSDPDTATRSLPDDVEHQRALKLHSLLTQPFFVTVGFLGRAGNWVELEDLLPTIEDVRAGRYDDTPQDAFLYVGAGPRAERTAP